RFVHGQGALPGDTLAAWCATWLGALGVPVVIVYLSLLFPSGRPSSPRWRAFAIAARIVLGVGAVSAALTAGPLAPYSVDNPLGVPGARTVNDVAGALLLTIVLVAVIGLFRRFRAARGDEREQLKWLTAAGALTAALFLLGALIEALLVGAGPF